MAKSESNSGTALIVVGIIAFVIGRCSGDDPDPPEQVVQPLGFSGAAADADYSAEPVQPDQSGNQSFDERPSPPSAFEEPPAPPMEEQTYFASPPAAENAYYANCSAARAAGAAPVRSGDPGYRRGLDRDGDGVGCE